MSSLRLDVITIFPEYLDPLRHALLGKAIEQGILAVGVHDLRDWATGNHKSVDAPPLGGGPGMVMKPEVWGLRLTTSPRAAPEPISSLQRRTATTSRATTRCMPSRPGRTTVGKTPRSRC